MTQKKTKKSSSRRRHSKGRRNPKTAENKGKLEISKRKTHPGWLSEDEERYIKAVSNTISKVPVREDGSVDMTEVWVNSSLPLDLVIEAMNHPEMNLPDQVKSLKLYGKEIWARVKEVL